MTKRSRKQSAWRWDTIANADDIPRQIAALKGRLSALERERSEIAEQLGVLARVQAEKEAKQPPDAQRTVARAGFRLREPRIRGLVFGHIKWMQGMAGHQTGRLWTYIRNEWPSIG